MIIQIIDKEGKLKRIIQLTEAYEPDIENVTNFITENCYDFRILDIDD